jgi:hypothetical protein
MLQRKQQKYYLKEPFQYYPYVRHGINVVEDVLLNGKSAIIPKVPAAI